MRASAFGWPRSVLPARGEPARPGFPPEGETGKGEIKFLAAAGIFLHPLRRPSPFRPSRLPAQRGLNALAPEQLEMIQRLPPMLDRVPLRADIPQR